MSLRGSRLLPVVALAALIACGDPTGPDERTELAFIAPPDPQISMIVDGDDIIVHAMTYGWDGCYSHHRDWIQVDDENRIATIRLYNKRAIGGACPDVVVEIPHRADVDTDVDGQWTVRVIGRAPTMPPGSDELVVEGTVWVGPGPLAAS
ncbi:MAG TPA: hypothetical protein VF039_06425 [Longimicrobiales bacterium]